MKKATILFLVLAIIFSFVGCSTASIDEEKTVTSTVAQTTISAEDMASASNVISWIDSLFEQKNSNSCGGLRPLIAEQINLHIKQKIAENPDEGPNYYSIEYLPHPEDTEGFFQISIRYDATNLNEKFLQIIESDNPKSELYIKGYSKVEVEDILSSALKEVENISSSFKYEVIECDYGYCCLVVYN